MTDQNEVVVTVKPADTVENKEKESEKPEVKSIAKKPMLRAPDVKKVPPVVCHETKCYDKYGNRVNRKMRISCIFSNCKEYHVAIRPPLCKFKECTNKTLTHRREFQHKLDFCPNGVDCKNPECIYVFAHPDGWKMPTCNNGDKCYKFDCPFVHPKTCKPDCILGIRCNDVDCHQKRVHPHRLLKHCNAVEECEWCDCPFAHSAKNMPKEPCPQGNTCQQRNQVCEDGKPRCKFSHPKPVKQFYKKPGKQFQRSKELCKFRDECNNANCWRTHPADNDYKSEGANEEAGDVDEEEYQEYEGDEEPEETDETEESSKPVETEKKVAPVSHGQTGNQSAGSKTFGPTHGTKWCMHEGGLKCLKFQCPYKHDSRARKDCPRGVDCALRECFEARKLKHPINNPHFQTFLNERRQKQPETNEAES